MSYHRGGHPGAVAVSFSASTMAPLSPSRRYSGSTGSGAGSTSGTTSKYASHRSSSSSIGSDRPGSFYSSASSNGYRTSSFSSSSDSYRRPFIAPSRSVSTHSESSSIVGSSSLTGSRYGSASSSSASSTASSTSSSASRERNGLHTSGNSTSTTTAAELYAKYSPTNYVPNIHNSSTTSNGYWRPPSSSSSSGISSGPLAELHGGDEYDSCRERRDRSYSSEGSSGIGLSSNSTSSNHVPSGLAERWSAKHEAKRRGTPGLGSGGTVLAGHAHLDSASAPTEVTLNADGRNNISTSFVSLGDSSSNRRATTAAAAAAAASSSPCDIASSNDTEKFDDIAIENSRDKREYENADNRDVDNNNARNNNNSNSNKNDDDLIIGRESTLEVRRRRRRESVEQLENGERSKGETDDNNHTNNVNNDDLVVIRNNRDNNEDNNCNGKSEISRKSVTSVVDSRGDDHHGHSSEADESRKFVASIPAVSSNTWVNTNGVVSPTATRPTLSSSSFTSESAKTTESSPVSSSNSRYASASAVPQKSKNFESRGIASEPVVLEITEKIFGNHASDKSSVATPGDGGDGRSGGDADHHRTAYTWTKIPTNPDNTELLTNNNAQDREVAVLGIADTSGVDTEPGRDASTVAANSAASARKSLLWTSNNRIDATFNSRNDIHSPVKDLSKDEIPDKSDVSGLANGLDKTADSASTRTIYDVNREESITNGLSTGLRNGVAVKATGTRGDDSGRPSTSRRAAYGWSDTTIDDLTSSTAAASSSSTSNSVPVAVHQNVYRGISDQIDEGSNSRSSRNRLQSRRDERYGLNGLRNIGNTCFMNSVIQCLSNTRPLLEYLLNEQHLHDINTTTSSMKGALIKAFGQVIHELWEMSGDHVVNTTALKSQIQRFAPRFMGYSQQDAQEFLRYLLEGLHEDVNRVTVKPQPILTDIPDHYSDSHKAAESWKRYLRSEDSTIVDVFVGQLRSSLHCTSCDHVSVTLDPVWDLSLPIPVRSGTVKLNQCLEHFTKVETLDGDEKPTCSKCQMRRKCTKSFSIQKFPKILVIHLKRFSPTERFRGKLSVLVDFPLTGLDLSAFAAPGVQGCTYNLYGVANHSGTTYSGHYTAYCKHPYSGEWHEYNDNRVSTVPARSVVSSEAYVLFYEQQPLSPHL